ncbi:MAG: hypothetical protein WD988_04150 [Candidatus Curtissbacteria bacterium]
MPQRKITENKITKANANIVEKLTRLNIYLTTAFLVIWIFVGLFASFIVVQNLKGIFASQPATTSTEPPVQTQADLPGVGKVDIACVEQALSQEAISKILQSGDTSGLTDDENAKLDLCIVEAATPSAGPETQ